MAPRSVCSHCGCTEIDIDQSRGNAVCTACGSVLEDQIIVSELQFQESAGGSSSLIGQFVGEDGPKHISIGSSFPTNVGRESKQETLMKVKRKVQHLGGQLRLNQHCIDTAFNFFKMAYYRRLTRSRKTMNVVAACLYLVCRTEGTPHMLLDLSDLLQVNVYTLGKIYLLLSRQLCINVPAIDPCLYIPRFAHKLQFGEKTHEVSMTALRLVQRMKRDWMHMGRRPSGLCGAALLVAARIHDFCRTLWDILKVVKVCENTLRKRLAEFSNTPSSQLTIDEFQRIDLEDEQDPPAFSEAKRKAKLAHLEHSNFSNLTDEVSQLQLEIEKSLEASRPKGGVWSSYTTSAAAEAGCESTQIADDSLGDEIDVNLCDDESIIFPFTDKESEQTQAAAQSLPAGHACICDDDDLRHGDSRDGDSVNDRCTDRRTGYVPASDDIHQPHFMAKRGNSADTHDYDVEALEEEELSKLTMGDICMDDIVVPAFENSPVKGPQPTAASLGITASVVECMGSELEKPATVIHNSVENAADHCEDGELALDDLNDEELDRFILTAEEVEVKTKIWMQDNADYLKEQEEKLEREERERLENPEKAEKKKRRASKRRAPIQANTAGEAIEQMLQQKRISSKINYDVLRDLTAGPTTASVSSAHTSVVSTQSSRSKMRAYDPLETKAEIMKDELQPLVKRLKMEAVEAAKAEEIIVESGPVEYIKQEVEVEQAEDEEEDEYDDEPVSAAQLMLGHGQTDYDGGEYSDTYDEYD